jgi:hypothetical protein
MYDMYCSVWCVMVTVWLHAQPRSHLLGPTKIKFFNFSIAQNCNIEVYLTPDIVWGLYGRVD